MEIVMNREEVDAINFQSKSLEGSQESWIIYTS